jgi:hypothetical protein
VSLCIGHSWIWRRLWSCGRWAVKSERIVSMSYFGMKRRSAASGKTRPVVQRDHDEPRLLSGTLRIGGTVTVHSFSNANQIFRWQQVSLPEQITRRSGLYLLELPTKSAHSRAFMFSPAYDQFRLAFCWARPHDRVNNRGKRLLYSRTIRHKPRGPRE